MAKPLRIGSLLDGERSFTDTVAQLQGLADAGFDHAFATQMFTHDALTLLAAAGSHVPGIAVGTCVTPVYPRHPTMLAQQALTTQSATGNRLILGIGLSHQVVIEGMWGISFDKPARYMKEYLSVLMPLLNGETVNVSGDRITANTFAPIAIPDVTAPPVLVAALGSLMLRLAGTVADGTVTWMTGTNTVESHIAPTIRAAAEAAGRPVPRIAVCLPVCVTADVEAARAQMDQDFSIYPNLPSYKAMLDLEGVARPSDIAFVGDEDTVVAAIERLAAAGATDFGASISGTGEERERTFALLSELARSD
jgi:5,10-methylenetetrahydromethanopterin reductase